MFDNLTVLSMAKKSMGWIAQRQEVVAENIANANTPAYLPKDLKPLDFKQMVHESGKPPVLPVSTNSMHIVPQLQDPNTIETTKKTYESSPDGNAVVLEEQMAKLGDAKSAYEMAAGLFQKQISLLKLAVSGR
jgi:flagellar basal-body rod protein FlgB